jgi:hypothetical protein
LYSGYFALPGANSRLREFLHASLKNGRMDGVAACGYIFGQMCSSYPQRKGEGIYEKKFIYRNGEAA